MGRPTNEQETTITWMRNDTMASIFTSDSTMMTRFDKFVENGDWKVGRITKIGDEVVAKWYTAPKELLFGRGRSRQYTDEQKEALGSRLKSRNAL